MIQQFNFRHCLVLWLALQPLSIHGASPNAHTKHVVNYWTPQRRAMAVPMDLVIDQRGLGYLRKTDGTLIPRGHNVPPVPARQLRVRKGKPSVEPTGKGGGISDTEPPVISNMTPSSGSTIGVSHTFAATVTDDQSGVKSVNFILTYPDGTTTQSFNPTNVGNNRWEVPIRRFFDGQWSWRVVAKDEAPRGGNTASSADIPFTVSTTGGGGSTIGDYIITNAQWEMGGDVLITSGRLYFETANDRRGSSWSPHYCSGAVIDDNGTSDRSIVITAAHCVYDDVYKAFARNVLFIPNQGGTTGGRTDTDCTNDPLGCWSAAFGVVDVNWTTRRFPRNKEWDYGYYVFSDSGAHIGSSSSSSTDSLDTEAGSLPIQFQPPSFNDNDPSATSDDFTHALGYSWDYDPNLMYCADDMTTEGAVNWWLPNCELSAGSSGGPWIQPMDTATGRGPIVSIVSWSYVNLPGMAGLMLSGTSSASCLLGEAKTIDFSSVSENDGDAGIILNCS